MALEPGALLNNRYRIIEILGLGGMGSVYKAEDENLSVPVAVKENLFTSEDFARQFRREAVILAGLRHPNLPRVTDHFVIEGEGQYLVMDYIEGEDLRQRMDRLGILSEDEVITIGLAMCDALSYLGSRNPLIVHRDIKPGNVKITPQGEIFLVDFGLAKIWDTSQKTATGARAMTPGYSPPEQYGTARTDQRSDIYSLGATLYAALTSYIPEDAMSRAMGQDELTPIQKTNPMVSARISETIEKALAIRPSERYQNGQEFKRALLIVNSDIGRDTGEYRVAPPPEIPPAVPADDGLEISSVEGTPGSTYKSVSPREEHARAASSIANAVPLEPNFRQSNRVLLGLLIVITIAAIILFIAIRTDLPERAFAIVQPATLTPTITNPVVTHTPNTQEQISTGAAVIQTTLTTEIAIPPTSTPTPSISPTTTSTPTQTPSPTVSPSPIPTSKGGGQGEIAYASDRRGIPQIFLVEIDTGRTRQLTNIPEGACQPSWSPDGVFLLFISPCAKNQEEYPGSALFMIEVDQLNPEPMPLPHIPGGDYDPDWSPDGKNIAFTSHQKAGYPRIYIMDVEDQTMTLLSDKFSREKQPVWSSDGKMIAYLTAPNGVNEIWVMNADGSNKTRFTKSTDANNLYPDWSPGEDIILFTQYKPSKQVPGLVAGYYDEGDYTEFPINVGPLPMREAKYSPDGVWIVFEGWPRAGNHEIIIMTTNGANLQQITNLPSFDFDPTWRPAVLEPTP